MNTPKKVLSYLSDESAILKLNNVLNVFNLLAAICIVVISAVVFYYTDFSDTLDNSVMLAESIFGGGYF